MSEPKTNDVTNRKVLITGSQGFIGQALLAKLSEKNINIVTLGKDEDITKWDCVKHIGDIDIVCHLAAVKNVPHSFKEPKDTYHVNLMGTLNMLEVCRRYDAKMIFPSTAYVYGRPEYLPIDEKHPVNPSNPYARSKLLGEELCRAYNEDYGVKCIILRLFNIYGKNMDSASLIMEITRQMLRNKKIIVEDFTPKRDFVFVGDVANAFLRSMMYDASYEVFNIGCGGSHSVREIATKLIEIYGEDIKIETLNRKREDEILELRANIDKAQKELGWSPKYDINEGLSEVLSWARQGAY